MHLQPLTSAGQIKKGDTILIESKDGSIQAATAKRVINPGSTTEGMREEVVFNMRQNLYFITDLYLHGKSWAKEIRILRSGPEASDRQLLEALKEVVTISDRKHDAWDRAKVAIAKAQGVEQSAKEPKMDPACYYAKACGFDPADCPVCGDRKPLPADGIYYSDEIGKPQEDEA
jgi:hypothetical protein